MQNDEGEIMDLYIPRKCSATNRLITAKDHASVQLNIGHLDERGVYTGSFTTLALSGFVRAQGMLTVLLIASGKRRRLNSVSNEMVVNGSVKAGGMPTSFVVSLSFRFLRLTLFTASLLQLQLSQALGLFLLNQMVIL